MCGCSVFIFPKGLEWYSFHRNTGTDPPLSQEAIRPFRPPLKTMTLVFQCVDVRFLSFPRVWNGTVSIEILVQTPLYLKKQLDPLDPLENNDVTCLPMCGCSVFIFPKGLVWYGFHRNTGIDPPLSQEAIRPFGPPLKTMTLVFQCVDVQFLSFPRVWYGTVSIEILV